VVSTYLRDPRDVIFASENMTQALIPDPAGDSDDKNKYWRRWPQRIIEFADAVTRERTPEHATPGAASALLSDPDMLRTMAEIALEEGSDQLKALAQKVLAMMPHEHWPQHLEEAQDALRVFSKGARLFSAGQGATLTHADLIREGYVIFLVGPQAYMNRLGGCYALHLQAFCEALYSGADVLRTIADEFTNTPLKTLIEALTTLRAFGGEFHFIAQSRSEIIRRFGEQECRTLEENAIVKQYFGFSSFEEAERVSKAMGEEHAVASGLSGDEVKTSLNLSLIKQRHMSPSELMAMPRGQQLVHVKGLGFCLLATLSQQNIAPYCHSIGDNEIEGRRLTPDPLITLLKPRGSA